MAERACGATDRLDPQRMPRPHRGGRGATPAACSPILHGILQRSAHTSVLKQGRADGTCRPTSRTHPGTANPGRSPSSICSDLICDRDRLARQITEAFPWASAPAFLVRDNDRAYGQVFTARVMAMGIRDRPIAPRSPWQNGIAERLIGTLRRECLDHMVISGEAYLRRILSTYAAYYNQTRTHLALNKDCPLQRPVQRFGRVVAIPVLAGLHHHYVRI